MSSIYNFKFAVKLLTYISNRDKSINAQYKKGFDKQGIKLGLTTIITVV